MGSYIEQSDRLRLGENELEPVKSSLCPDRNACPEVEGVGDEVRIREAGAPVVLKKGEENVLVDLIQGGRLSKLRAGRGRRDEGQSGVPRSPAWS